jgi:hypothetical protein
MPKIEQLDWSKLKPSTPEVRPHKLKQATYRDKRIWKPQAKKVKLDPRIAYEQHMQREHLRSIKNEL